MPLPIFIRNTLYYPTTKEIHIPKVIAPHLAMHDYYYSRLDWVTEIAGNFRLTRIVLTGAFLPLMVVKTIQAGELLCVLNLLAIILVSPPRGDLFSPAPSFLGCAVV